jgi:hypothetical protein
MFSKWYSKGEEICARLNEVDDLIKAWVETSETPATKEFAQAFQNAYDLFTLSVNQINNENLRN